MTKIFKIVKQLSIDNLFILINYFIKIFIIIKKLSS